MHMHGIRLTDEAPLPGCVVQQYVRHSDRPNCKCNRRGKLHGPYYYRTWPELLGYTPDWQREPILKWHKQYVPLRDVRSVLARCRQHRIDQIRLVSVPLLLDLMHGNHPLAHVTPRDLRRKWQS